MAKIDPPLPDNEVERITALARYDVLDTAPEEVFDNLTFLAAKVCGFPISLMTLVDEKRQWFKSVVGLDVHETARSISFCTYTIQHSNIMIVPDATKDERFANNPLVTSDPQIRFYAGAPLITPDGFKLGTLCVIDRKPREFTPEQQKILKILANQAMKHLELRVALRTLATRTLELKRAYEGLSDSEQRFRVLFQQAGVGVAQIHIETGQFFEVNRKYADLLGYTPEEMKQIYFETTISQADLAAYWEKMEQLVIEQPCQFSIELRMVRKSGRSVWVNLDVSPMYSSSEPSMDCIAVVQDITVRKHAEEAVEKALQKETALNREIHHRVKNNLQVISSVLFLQSDSASDPKVAGALRESQLRVRSVALIHEKLYRSNDLSRIAFGEYATALAHELISAYKVNGGTSVQVRVHAEGILLGLDTAVPCGFILTELVTNALKHAFPGRKRGQITISLISTDDDFLRFEVCDDGVGFPENFRLDETKTLGLTLVKDLTRQLDGTIEFLNCQGTVVRITLPRAKNDKAPRPPSTAEAAH